MTISAKPDAKARRVVPAKLAHFVVRTANYEAMIKWYATVLQTEFAFKNDQLCFITYDDEHHRVGFVNIPNLGPQDPKACGVEHIAFTYATLEDLLLTYVRLADQGIVPFWTINHGPTTSMYYRDPDGNKLELQVDNFATKQEVDAFFAAGHYEENPMGIIFEPQDWIARYNAGVPIRELTTRPKLPPGMTPWDMFRP